MGRKAVKRNVVYYKSRFVYKQVDIEFRDYHPFNSLVIVEAKYLRKDNLRLRVRRVKKKAGQNMRSLDTLLDEVEERRRFVHARHAIIATNTGYPQSFYDAVEQYPKITLYAREDLEALERKRKGVARFFSKNVPFEQQIHNINLKEYNLKSERTYLE